MPKGIMIRTIALAAVGMAMGLLLTFAVVTTTSRPAMANADIAKKPANPVQNVILRRLR